jgi:hypothetical protein
VIHAAAKANKNESDSGEILKLYQLRDKKKYDLRRRRAAPEAPQEGGGGWKEE